jgi:hypothetical protein
MKISTVVKKRHGHEQHQRLKKCLSVFLSERILLFFSEILIMKYINGFFFCVSISMDADNLFIFLNLRLVFFFCVSFYIFVFLLYFDFDDDLDYSLFV